MGCLVAKTDRRNALGVTVERLHPLCAEAARMAPIRLRAERIGPLSASARRTGALRAAATLICTVSDRLYLRVTPKETQWVSEWESAAYAVYSNTDWQARENNG